MLPLLQWFPLDVVDPLVILWRIFLFLEVRLPLPCLRLPYAAISHVKTKWTRRRQQQTLTGRQSAPVGLHRTVAAWDPVSPRHLTAGLLRRSEQGILLAFPVRVGLFI